MHCRRRAITMTTRYDAIIIGAGHYGLVCAAHVARQGLRPLVLERRDIIGGAAATEEIKPGFRASTFTYLMSGQHGFDASNFAYSRIAGMLGAGSLDRAVGGHCHGRWRCHTSDQ
jgi:cation diffusion facilitator CzcD-associated flavoprotein CzcO